MKVLLATDGSVHAAHAERVAASVAWPPGTAIDALAVTDIFAVDRDIPLAAVTALRREIDRQTDDHLASVRVALAGAGRKVGSRRGSGRPGEVIVEEAAAFGADLIVMGSRGRGFLPSTLLGSVAAEVVDHAACPVLIARTDGVHGLVLADDGSATARSAADVVTGWGAFGSLPHHVVSVTDLAVLTATVDPVGMGPFMDQRIVDSLGAQSRRIATEGADRLVAKGIRATAHATQGFVTPTLVEVAARNEADLIVVGSRGNTGLKRAVLGSVARGVLFSAPCSVLVVKAKE
ncbi:MAG: hypothetical protein FJ034_05685 [Chloroflexi bacterium]|nr:hypothetical protein [Chloroflexota bacterium]